MRSNIRVKFVLAVLIVVLLTSSFPALLLSGVDSAQASFPGPNLVLGFIKSLGALNKRNRIYSEAGATAQEINAYYDKLISKAQSQRTEMISRAADGEVSPIFVRSYVRIEAALEAERNSAIQMVEAEKNQARLDFNSTLVQEITNILIASPGGQKILDQVRDTIKGVKEAAVTIQTAAGQGKPLERLRDALASEVSDIPVVQQAAVELGSAVGNKLDQALGGLLSQVEQAMEDVQGEMGEAIELLDEFDAVVAEQQETNRTPVSLVETEEEINDLTPIDRTNAVIDVISYANAGAAEINGQLAEGETREDMQDRIREGLLNDRVEGIQGLTSGGMAGKVFCTAVGRGEYELAARQLGNEPESAENPENAVYLVCYTLDTYTPVYAKMTEPDIEENKTTTPMEEEVVTATPEEKAPTATVDLSEYAGTYVGTTNFVDSYYDSWEDGFTTVTKNEIIITITENGTVDGSFVAVAASPQKSGETLEGTCFWQAFYAEEGVIYGQISEPKGVVTIESTGQSTLVRSCLEDSTSEYSFEYKFAINIIGDTIEGSWMDETFEATKQ